MQVTLKIFRFNPEKDKKPHYETYTLDAEPTDRVLDLLEHVKGYEDGSLTFRRSCAHGVCGSDAMRINGRNRLACKVLVQDLSTNKITVEPLLGLKVLKDLFVDMEPFFEHYRSVMPYFVNNDPAPVGERLQSIEARERFDDTTKCILCAACTTSCPSFWANDKYVGPAAIVNAHRFIFDSRDQAGAERLQILNSQFGVYRCHTIFNCTEACPRDIEVTKAIGEVKRAIATGQID
jgi:succinate dehydrogenase / fumarate reductase, iron-sulfur subunit